MMFMLGTKQTYILAERVGFGVEGLYKISVILEGCAIYLER